MRTSRVLALLVLLVVGCDCEGPQPSGDAGLRIDAGELSGLRSLRIEPARTELTIMDGRAASQVFRAMGSFASGERDVTADATWSITSASPIGSFRGATFTTFASGGTGQVIARVGSISAMAPITVRVRASFPIEPGTGGTPLPADPGGRFSGTVSAARAPTLVYPNDGVVLPPNLGRVEVHWLRGPAENTLFEVAFTNALTDVRAYVRCARPARVREDGCIWEPSGMVWAALAETNRGGEALTISIRATDDTGSSVGASASRSLRFSRDPLMGTIYYWAVTRRSIMRYDFGAAATTAEAVLTPDQAGGGCVGCHAVSRDGRRIMGSVGGINNGGMLLYDLERGAPLRSEPTDHIVQFGSFSPDGNQMAGVYGDRGAAENRGILFFDTRCDASSMATCGQIVSEHSIEGREVSHPAWSPDGQHIAFTDQGMPSISQRPVWGGIGVIDRTAAGWSAPRFLVERAPGVSRINPDWAPDGSFLTFHETQCPGGDLSHMHCNGDSDPSSSVFAVRAAGGTPVRLASAMRAGTGDFDGRTELNNTFARFAPFEFVLSDGDVGRVRLMWMSFASTRAYGLRTPPEGGNEESGMRGTYLWMSAIQPSRLEAGADPSSPAFAIPFQDLDTSNHIAMWTTQAVGEPLIR